MLTYHTNVLVATSTALIITHLLWRFFFHPRFVSPLRSIPSVCTDWRTQLYRWIYTEPTPDQILSWLSRTTSSDLQHGLIKYPGIGGASRILLLSPAALREVLVTKAYSDFHKPPLNKQRLAMFGDGLLVSDGEAHRSQKKKMSPAFAPRGIRALVPMFWTKATELVRLLSQHINGSGGQGELEIAPWTSRASLDVIGVAAWGKDFGALANPQTDVVRRYHRMFRGTPRSNQQAKLIYAAGLLVPLSTLKKVFPCEFFENLADGTRAIRQAAAAVIAEKKGREDDVKEDDDILSRAMSTDAFDDAGLAGQMLNVLAAGHETSSLATTWACYLLAQHSNVQMRLREEVRELLPSPSTSGEVTAEMLESLPYLRAVVRETLRLIPPAPVTRREARVDTTVAGHVIPAGTGIIALHKHFNTLPEVWGPNAGSFEPQRWLDEEAHCADKLFLTFNIGPRSCIGEGFARLEVSALLAALVGRFEIGLKMPESEPEVIYGITVKPVGLEFGLKYLEGW